MSYPVQGIPERLPDQPLPGGVAEVVRAIFSLPQWVLISASVLGALVAVAVVALAWNRRRAIAGWVRTRGRPIQIALGVVAAALLIAVLGASKVSWDYMQHDNGFCTGCHVMTSAFQRFERSEHSDLSCHDCHQQSIFASMRQLYLWIADRPEEIGEHSPVPTAVCERCHVEEDPEERWQRIRQTAGHLVHLESDSSALADVQCVTCHGQEVHEFLPADQTCGQSGCHASDATQVAIGAMAEQTGLHCVTCHEFTADPAGTEVESATGLLTPGLQQCFACHEMEDLLAAYDPIGDPHDARCGACHNPHEQESPQAAQATCAEAGCHARPDTLSTFHLGIPDEVAADCVGCHVPHEWERDGNDCASCHAEILGRVAGRPWSGRPALAAGPGRSAHRPAPSLLAGPAVHERVSEPAGPTLFTAGGEVLASPRGAPRPSTLRPDSRAASVQQEAFSHREHADVECTECHSSARRHGEVMVRTRSDCFECHHSTATAAAGCGECHGPRELGQVRQVSTNLQLSVWEAPRLRRLPFDHDEHAALRCVECHGGGTSQRVQVTCAECHDGHHPVAAETRCLACHEEHREDAHTAAVHTEGCTGSGCHERPQYERMQPSRNFCTSCHQGMVDHERGEPCVNCHLVPTDEPPGGGG